MKVRLVSLVLGVVTAAAAEPPSAPISVVEETGQVPLDCDKKLGAYQFMKARYEQKVKANTHTWEDVANYHSTRGDWLECVSNGQFQAIKTERAARNELIVQLNAARSASAQLDDEIAAAQQLFAQCDKAPLPADQAMRTCGPQAFVEACAASTLKRLFARENFRTEGPRAHMIRSITQQSLVRRVGLLQCLSGSPPTEVAAAEVPANNPPAPPVTATAQQAAATR
jgi:hypothetical protein